MAIYNGKKIISVVKTLGAEDASQVGYDNAASHLQSDNVQDAIDEVNGITAGKLDKDTSVGPLRVYAVGNAGNQQMYECSPNVKKTTIVLRSTEGTFTVAEPTNGAHPTTKNYVDDLASSKLDKETSETQYSQVYLKTASGVQTMNNVATGIIPSAIIRRDTDGNFSVNEPTEESHPTTKNYVDTARNKKTKNFIKLVPDYVNNKNNFTIVNKSGGDVHIFITDNKKRKFKNNWYIKPWATKYCNKRALHINSFTDEITYVQLIESIFGISGVEIQDTDLNDVYGDIEFGEMFKQTKYDAQSRFIFFTYSDVENYQTSLLPAKFNNMIRSLGFRAGLRKNQVLNDRIMVKFVKDYQEKTHIGGNGGVIKYWGGVMANDWLEIQIARWLNKNEVIEGGKTDYNLYYAFRVIPHRF